MPLRLRTNPRINRGTTATHLLGWHLWMRIKHSHRKIIMTHIQIIYPNRIALCAGKKGVRPAEVGALALVFEKSATELKQKQKFTKCKSIIQIATFNVRNLNRIGQLREQTASAIDLHIDIICVQEHRNLHSEDIK